MDQTEHETTPERGDEALEHAHPDDNLEPTATPDEADAENVSAGRSDQPPAAEPAEAQEVHGEEQAASGDTREDAEPTALADDAEPTTPAVDHEPVAPEVDVEPAAPASDREPVAPEVDAEHPAQAPDVEPVVPAEDAEQTASAEDGEAVAPEVGAESGEPQAGTPGADSGQPESATEPRERSIPAGDSAAPAGERRQKRGTRSRRATRPASAPVHEEPETPPERLDVLAEFAASPAAPRPDQPDVVSAAALTRIVFEAPDTASDQRGADEREGTAPRGTPSARTDEERDEAQGATRADAGPRLPVTALLFQAPDLSFAQRSRRAQSPAGPPLVASEEEAVATPDAERGQSFVEDALAIEDEADVDSEDEVTLEGAVAPAAAAAQRRRRRRGGRGRRSRTTGPSGAEEDEHDELGPEGESAPDEVPDESTESGQLVRTRPRSRSRGQRRAAEVVEPDAAGSAEELPAGEEAEDEGVTDEQVGGSSRRRRRRRRGSRLVEAAETSLPESRADEVTALKGSTRLEAKRQRRREGRDAGRRRTVVTEAEFLARRESVERSMVVREKGGRTQIAVLEDGVLVEHFVARRTQTSMVGNVYLGRVQNVLPSMEAAFVDLGKGRNAVLYAGEVNWDAAGMEGQPRRIEQALTSGDSVMVQVTKDPIGHKGARLTSQITLAGRYLVLVPSGAMTGISRKLPDTERARLKKLLREIVPDGAGVIVRTAAEGASEEELRLDVARLQVQWAEIERKAKGVSAPALLHGEPDLAIRVVRDVFNEDFGSVTIAGDEAWDAIAGYIESVAPDLAPRLHRWTSEQDVFAAHRIDEQLAKALDRKVWLPSGGSLVIDRTEAMTVIDVNTGKFTGAGGTLEETVTKNNLEAAEEIVRQLRLRDIGGIIVIDFIDMVLESNRDLVLRRLVECLGRDRTRHQVAEVTSLGLVQMTRKRVGQGLLEAFSEPCEVCNGRGYLIQSEPVEKAGRGTPEPAAEESVAPPTRRRGRRAGEADAAGLPTKGRAPNALPKELAAREAVKATLATIAAAAAHAHEEAEHGHVAASETGAVAAADDLVSEPHEGLIEGLPHEEPEGGEGREADRGAPRAASANGTPDGPGGTGHAGDAAGLAEAVAVDDGSVHAPLGSVDRDASERV